MMNDHDLRELLKETCPVRPGQEARSWNLLQARLAARSATNQPALMVRSLLGGGLATAAAIAWLLTVTPPAAAPLDYASAESQAPGIYATSFYSKKANAQVIWLNGLKPATNAPARIAPAGPRRPEPMAAPVRPPAPASGPQAL